MLDSLSFHKIDFLVCLSNTSNLPRLMNHILANFSCSNFRCSFFPLPVSIFFFPFPKCKQSFPRHSDFSIANNNAIMPRNDNDDDDRRQRDEDEDERRRRRQEEEKKKNQRRKKARRPDLADTPADLGVANLFDGADPPQSAGKEAAVEDPSLGALFAPAADSLDEDELLKSSADEEEGEVPSFEDDEEGMDVDSNDVLPSNPSAPPPPQERPRSGTTLCHKEALPTEVEIGPTGDWAPSKQADGSFPETTREVGCQANVGLERLARRMTWLKASRRRYRLNRLKRRRQAALPPPAPVPEAASTASDPPPPPLAKKPRPSSQAPTLPPPSSTSPPETSRGQKGAKRRDREDSKGPARGGQGSKPKRGGGGRSGQVAKDQRVVVVIPPEVSATKTTVANRETARVPSKRADSLPQNPPREQQKRGRSLSKSRQDEVVASKKKRERWETYPRQRSPSPGPSHRRTSLPPAMPSSLAMNQQEVQWMVMAMATAFEAQQRFRQQQQQQEQEQQPPQSSSSRSRSTSRKGKGPGKGKGRGRGK